MVNESVPAMQKVRAIDVRPYQWALWCTVAGIPQPFANEIEHRQWIEDGQSIWFGLGTHAEREAGRNARPRACRSEARRSRDR